MPPRSFHSRRPPQEGGRDNLAAQRIVTAARAHFFAHGFRSVTMDDLAEELGMSKKTLYASFASKAALLQAVLMDKFRNVEADLDAIMAQRSDDTLTDLQRFLACMQQHAEEIQPPFVRDIRREAPELFQVIEKRRREMIQRYFGKIFAEGRKAGLVRKDIPVKLIIEILLGAVQAIMNPSKMDELGLDPKTGYSSIVSVILDGVILKKARTI